ncbi:MAG: NnrS family protein [Alcanivoracaceae bacterium]|nr:NnrS family protein [Alcanivoracaceae bacterium]
MKNRIALFSVGFRPFFLATSVFAILAMTAWVAVFLFSMQLSAFKYYPMMIWHAHEMVFAYSMAVVAGFLLTAIKNWTGIQTVNGTKLMFLVGIWIIGRITPFVIDTPWIIALLDIAFLPLLAYFIAIPLIKAGNKRNYFMIVLILIFAILNILVHLELLGLKNIGVLNNFANHAIKTAFYLLIALIIIMAGRVFPMFSQNGVANKYQAQKHPLIEKLIMPSYLLFMLSIIYIRIPLLIFLSSIFAAIIHAVRLRGWYNKQIWQVPLVWALHVGYLFLIIGFIMSAVSAYDASFYFIALHAFSVGTLSMITLAMMARVGLGHTGRNIGFPPKLISKAFLFMLSATIIRTIVPIFVHGIYQWTIIISGILWIVAFLLYVISYAKFLTLVRADA